MCFCHVTITSVSRDCVFLSCDHHVLVCVHRLTFKQYRDKYREKVKSLSPSSSLLKQIQASDKCRSEGVRQVRV